MASIVHCEPTHAGSQVKIRLCQFTEILAHQTAARITSEIITNQARNVKMLPPTLISTFFMSTSAVRRPVRSSDLLSPWYLFRSAHR